MSLLCGICGLPTVTFGGEDVCTSESHAAGWEDDADPEWERRLDKADRDLDWEDECDA